MNLVDIEELLKRTIGLDAASIGISAVERAVVERMNALGRGDAQAYAEHVRVSPGELQALVETIVVPETWFFRDREAFGALARLIYEDWLRDHLNRGVFRALSLPCSTGEEPYSIAMALLDAGVPATRFVVEAIDVSDQALAKARQAVYGKNSFRGADLAFRDRYFTTADARWALGEAVRAQVRFERGNLLDPALANGREPYDAIFCRNLLIYFDRPTQDRAVATLAALLAPNGLLFVGPSETGLYLSHGFDSVRVPLAFAFRRPSKKARLADTDGVTPLQATRQARRVEAPVRPAPRSPAKATGAASRPAVPPPSSTAEPATIDPLEEIARLADQGHFAEAGRQCEAYLRQHARSARGFYLLGIVRDATGQHGEAAELYRKAIYLEPNHHDALMHLAYLLEGQGDRAAAEVLTARARRVAQKQKR